ncbi:TonB-dependent receptor [Dyella tabacisoli]|uniref:TonB-dependent receptor n=1 Tax=Dyella tabacisoli TaxID=2282381 RepID=A0A369UH32_9GAMM|nr:TonB-dependent receptor [Dyella tabacisoli]RDD80062.1 TonB-dependent receptor [Dyella tabacisoli]
MSLHNLCMSRPLRRTALAVGLGLCVIDTDALAQSAAGAIFGQTGVSSSNSTIVIENMETGLTRTVPVDSAGRYRISALPTGKYKVMLRSDGATVSTRDNVVVSISGGTEVSFAAEHVTKNLEGVSVVASVLPPIDVSSVDTRTVFSAEQLSKLPIGRDIAAAALLAPSVVTNSAYDVPSFGGSASSENAYYINGYAVTNPLTAIGHSTLPFDAIDEMQVLTGGYGAEFGRSTGGVINITTKRGTNEWKGGVAAYWSPAVLRASPRNTPYPQTGFYPDTDGTLRSYRNKNQYWTTSYGAYIGGPLIKDRLFVYLSGEIDKREGANVRVSSADPRAANGFNQYSYKMPRWVAKVDWNINDSNIVELTAVSDKKQYESALTGFDYSNYSHNGIQTGGIYTKDGGELYIGKYTGYLADNLTFTALYGEQTDNHIESPWKYDPNCPRIVGNTTAINQMPGITYNATCQFARTVIPDGSKDKTEGWRLDLEYRLGDHSLRIGADNQEARSITGGEYAGGYVWVFQQTANKNSAVNAGLGVGSPASAGGSGAGVSGSNKGYFVRRQYYSQFADVKVEQSSQYIEDRWQVTNNLLLSLGLRNEQFTNYNSDSLSFISQRHQLAPRIGASWDVFGDATLKVFGNAGRYHLAPPNNVAVRGASASLYTVEYFTYTGTDPRTGAPIGLKSIPVDASKGYTCAGGNAVSSNLECGQSLDPRTVAAKNMKSHFQDEYILGMQHQLTPAFNWGAKATFRTLRSAIDDTCTPTLGGACYLFNPGVANTFEQEQIDGSFKTVTYSAAELNLPKLKRKYYAIDLFAEHPFDGKWYGKLEYTFSRNYGNTEGQLASDLDTGSGGQSDVSRTQDWDLPQLMVGANGLLPNHRKHQIKAFGYYQITPEWRIGATAVVASGRSVSCNSYYPTADRGLYGGSYYYYCGLAGSGTSPGSPNYVPPSADYRFSPRGTAGSTPWTYTFNVNVAYMPRWADNKLTFKVDALNVFNRQIAQGYIQGYASDRETPSQTYRQELNYTTPRQVRLSARYDFTL